MKYKVGDVVKLKSKEELLKAGCNCAIALEGAKVNILGIIHGLYIIVHDDVEYHFGDEVIQELISESEKDDTYTLKELKARVDDLNNYLKGYVNETRSLIMIDIKTEPNICPCGGDIANVNSLIKIIN